MESDSFDSTHYLMAELGVSFNPDTFDSLVDSMSTSDPPIDTSSSLNASSPSPPLAAASEPTTEDEGKRKPSKKLEGLSEEEADAKRRRMNEQERERQKAMKIAFDALGGILPQDNSMSGHPKGSKIWILETAIGYIGELTIQVNRLKDTKDLPVVTAPSAPPMSTNIPAPPMSTNIPAPPMSTNIPAPPMSTNIPAPPMSTNIPAPPMSTNIPAPPMSTNIPAPPMSANIPAPPMNPMPDTLIVSQPLATVHQNEQVPFFGQQNLSIDQATRHQPTVASKPEHFIYDGSSNPTCLWGGLNPPHQTTILAPGPHSSHPMNVPNQTELHPGECHMGPRHHGPPMMQHDFSAPSFSPYNLPALASSVDCSPILPTPHGHNFFYSTPKTHLPSPAYPTPVTNRIMSDSGYSGISGSITFDSSTNSSKSSKSRRRKKSTTFSPYRQDRTLDETISFTYQPY